MIDKKKVYDSTRWKRKREHILKRDKYRCQLSKRYGKNVDAKVVHHIYPLLEYPQYAFCDWNLISVSNDMHERLHERKTGELSPEGKQLMRRTKIIPPHH